MNKVSFMRNLAKDRRFYKFKKTFSLFGQRKRSLITLDISQS